MTIQIFPLQFQSLTNAPVSKFPIAMKTIQIFALILTLNCCCCSAVKYVDKKRYWSDIASPNVGRPSKVIIDEIKTRSVSYPAKSRYNLNEDNFSFGNFPKTEYPTSDYSSEDYPSTDLAPKKYPVADFMLTNRRRDDATDSIGEREKSYQLEGRTNCYIRYNTVYV